MNRLAKLTAFLALILVLFPLSGDAEAGWMQLRRERLEVGRALLEVQSSNLPSVIPYYTDDIEYHDPIVDIYGKEMMTQFLFRLFGSSPDLVTTIEDETLIGGVYSATWTMVGQFDGVPYESRGISIIKFSPGSAQVYYQRDYYSENDIMINIPGLDQAVIGFRTYYRCAVDPTFDCPLGSVPTSGLDEMKPLDNLAEGEKCGNWFNPRVRIRQARLEIGRALIEINAANWQSLLQYYTNDYEYYDPIVAIQGKQTLVPFLGQLFASSPDLITTVEDETLLGNVYMATWTMDGQFDGVPYSAKGMSIVKFRGRKAYYSRDYYTEGDIMASIPGLDEAVEGFRFYYRCAVDPTFDCQLGGPPVLGGPADKSNGLQPADTFVLMQNYPNPFNPATKISFAVPDGGAHVSLRIYDVTGRLVRTLVDGFEASGTRTVTWLGQNDLGQPVSSGTYFYQLNGPSFSQKKKMVLLK